MPEKLGNGGHGPEDYDINTGKYKDDGVPNKSDFKSDKQKQLEIILKHNPAHDDYHTWIRKIEDVKTLEETLMDSDWAEEESFNPDWDREMAEKAIKDGYITVYSSYPIEQGIFVSPSKMEAESYSGNGKIFSKRVPLKSIAWIDPTQGQYADISNFDTDINKQSNTLHNKKRIEELFSKAAEIHKTSFGFKNFNEVIEWYKSNPEQAEKFLNDKINKVEEEQAMKLFKL